MAQKQQPDAKRSADLYQSEYRLEFAAIQRHLGAVGTRAMRRGVDMKSRFKWFLAGAVLGLISSAAVAFQETQGGGGQTPAPAAQEKAPLDLRGTGTSIEPPGLEIRLPGLGKLGVLPKFDFGLELLYGIDQKAPDSSEKLRSGQDEDVKIRGSLKHRF